ncbi:MAG TPA: hypothetical protein VEY70_04360 [Metabacillus sp.]|nr:hypothetical protein [Metabacillus sp.]
MLLGLMKETSGSIHISEKS